MDNLQKLLEITDSNSSIMESVQQALSEFIVREVNQFVYQHESAMRDRINLLLKEKVPQEIERQLTDNSEAIISAMVKHRINSLIKGGKK